MLKRLSRGAVSPHARGEYGCLRSPGGSGRALGCLHGCLCSFAVVGFRLAQVRKSERQLADFFQLTKRRPATIQRSPKGLASLLPPRDRLAVAFRGTLLRDDPWQTCLDDSAVVIRDIDLLRLRPLRDRQVGTKAHIIVPPEGILEARPVL